MHALKSYLKTLEITPTSKDMDHWNDHVRNTRHPLVILTQTPTFIEPDTLQKLKALAEAHTTTTPGELTINPA